MQPVRPLPLSPRITLDSPAIVRTLDKVRFAFQANESMAEFCWFAREYPRVYRYHFSNVRHRLLAIYRRYQDFHRHFEKQLTTIDPNTFQTAVSNQEVFAIYWDFEAMLNATSSALDAIARVLTSAYVEHTPPSFSKLTAKSHLGTYVPILAEAKNRWVQRMKDYRDCFVHYTSVDTHLSCSCSRYQREWQVRCKLPVNPNARDIIAFRWSRRHDVLSYALTIWRHLNALDRKIAHALQNDFKAGTYPARTENLFNVGQRMHTGKPPTKMKQGPDGRETSSTPPSAQ